MGLFHRSVLRVSGGRVGGRAFGMPTVMLETVGRKTGDGFIMNISPGLGGPEPGPAGHLRQSERSGVTLYVQVRDLRASLAKAAELGATVVAEPFDVPGGPTLAGVLDPEGNPLMLVQQ